MYWLCCCNSYFFFNFCLLLETLINLGNEYRQKPLHRAKIPARDALKIALNSAIKTLELTSDSIDNASKSTSIKQKFDAEIQKDVEFDEKSIEKPN